MPVREKSYLGAILAGNRWGYVTTSLSSSESGTIWAVRFWNSLQQAKNPTTCTTNCGIPQEGPVPKEELFIQRFMPLQTPAVCATEVAAVL